MAQNCTISNSEFNGVVNGPARSGGILGVNLGGTNIVKTAASGAVKTQNEAGGILGWSSGTGSIIDSYSSAEITGKRDSGGIAGHINAAGFTIENSCSTSNITQTDWGLTGRLVGSLAAGATVKNCYYTGTITGGEPNNVGGFSGNTAGSYTSCFWNIDTSGKTKSAPNSTVAGVVGLDNTQIENSKIYQDSGWDNGHWLFDNGMPYLSWQDVSNNFDFQVGATTAADSIFSLDTGFGLGNFNIDFTTQTTSQDSIKSIQSLIDRLLGKQAKIGSSINALNSNIKLGSVMYENLTGAKSNIMDADMAKESSNLVRNQVLQQLSSNYILQMRDLNKNTVMTLLGS
jgi:flagellin-like hook-associated protein FlgL